MKSSIQQRTNKTRTRPMSLRFSTISSPISESGYRTALYISDYLMQIAGGKSTDMADVLFDPERMEGVLLFKQTGNHIHKRRRNWMCWLPWYAGMPSVVKCIELEDVRASLGSKSISFKFPKGVSFGDCARKSLGQKHETDKPEI